MAFRRTIIFFLALIFALFFGAQKALAMDFTPPPFKDLNYLGAYVSQSPADPVAIEAGATKEVTIKIKNAGTTTWYPTGTSYVSAYTVNSNYRASAFSNSSWISSSHPAKISAITEPGGIAEIKIKLTAPTKTGDYTEDFYLAAENKTWIKSSYFYLKIKVTAKSPTSSQPTTTVSNYTFTRDLEVGMSGADVKELQKFLNGNGFVIAASGVGSSGNETTLFGSLTKAALAKFQTAKKIYPAAGYFGTTTRGVINKLIASATASTGSSDSTSGNSTDGVNDMSSEVSREYQANLLAFSARSVTAVGGDRIDFTVRYRNNGTISWNSYLWQEAGSSREGEIKIATLERIALADSSWVSEKKIFTKTENILPGGVAEISFNFRAPIKQGKYTARFQLTANDHTLDGGTLELPVTVTADAPIGYVEPVFSTGPRALITEPKIRVGLQKTEDPVKFQSPFNYQIWSGAVLKGILPMNELAEVKYFDGLYTFKSASLSFTGRDLVRFVPVEAGSYFSLPSYSRLVSWKGSKNFNAYRNVMEYKFSTKSEMPWVVNELLLDEYIAGIGETSNGAAMEYIKAILTAARTYAYYHMNNGTPADQRTYDVVATTADQLYLGYNSEVLMPRVVQAARATYGEMVTYLGTPVVTPYFGHSDGRTRLWSQVWGGTDKAWLQPVVCKYDIGETMWGHGVGMSAQDAAYRADKDAWTYDQLLKYYYTGVEVERIY